MLSPVDNPVFDFVGHAVHLWLVDHRRAPLDACELLAAEERARASRFVHAVDREQFMASHAALRRILAGYLGLAPGSITYAHGEFGKPFLPGQPVAFSLSHSGSYSLVAVSPREVGVDLEEMRELPDLMQIAGSFFSASEAAELEALAGEAKVHRFFEFWTAREALGKAQGLGIANGLEAGAHEGWSIERARCPPGYAAALATEGARPAISYRSLGELGA